MRTYESTGEIGDVFNSLFDDAQDEIYKIGVLQNYTGEDAGASLQAWEAGSREVSMQLVRAESRYQDWMRRCIESPAQVTRVQIVERPLSPYMEWSVALFEEYQQAGAEHFRVVAAEDLGSLSLPASDVVIFDGKRVLQWDYEPDSNGAVAGGRVWQAEDGDDLNVFLRLQQEINRA